MELFFFSFTDISDVNMQGEQRKPEISQRMISKNELLFVGVLLYNGFLSILTSVVQL